MEAVITAPEGIQPGEILGGCRIESLLGKGGMGAVYEAWQISLERKVAIKVLRSAESAGEKEAQDRFLLEARLTAKLNHPNIVQVYDVGQDRGILYMVMEFVEGVTLKDLLRGQPVMPMDRLLRMAENVARALAAAHAAKIVHRDIKPENILLTSQGEVKIADFGSACSFSIHGQGPEETVFGTPAYVAPEIIRKEPSDGRADVYALGLILYRAAAGVHPFPIKDTQELLRAQIEKIPVPPQFHRHGMNLGLAQIIQRMCAKKPTERPTAQEILETIVGHPDWTREVELDGKGSSQGPKRSSLLDKPLLRDRRQSKAAASDAPPPELQFPSKWDKKTPAQIQGEGRNQAPPPTAGPAAKPKSPPPAEASSDSADELDTELLDLPPTSPKTAVLQPTEPQVNIIQGEEPAAGDRNTLKTSKETNVPAEAGVSHGTEAPAGGDQIGGPGTPEPRKKESLIDKPLVRDRRASKAAASDAPAQELEIPSKWTKKAPEPVAVPEAHRSATPAAADPPQCTGTMDLAQAAPAPAVPIDDPRVGELCVKARFLILKKKWTDAEARFREALAIDPDCEMALLGLARVFTEEARLDEATCILFRAIDSGKLESKQVLEIPHFQPLRGCKEFRRRMAEHSL